MKGSAVAPTPLGALPWLAATGFFMQTLDATILNTALPAMAADLGVSPLRMQSVVIAYLLTVAVLMPASGWLADRYGTRRVFQGAIVLFSAGSLLCALSTSLAQLVVWRVLQGLGGALLVPVGRLAVLRVVPRERLIGVLAFIAIPGLVGPLVGPTLGGWLVEVASWHWIFLINLPVGLVGVVVTARYMPNLRGPRLRFDLPGFGLFGTGMATITLGLQGLGEAGWGTRISMLLVFAGLACLAAYWLHAARAAQPLFSPRLFGLPTYGVALLGNLFARLGSGAMPFLTPLFLQVGLGYPPSVAGMTMIPAALGAIASKTFAEKLIMGLGYRRMLAANTVLLGTLIAGFAFVHPGAPHAWLLLHLGVFGIVNSLQFTAMNTLALGALDETSASGGNSLLSVVAQVSMGMGVAAAAALLAVFGGRAPVQGSPEVLKTFHATYACVGVLSALAAIVFLQLRPHEGRLRKDAAVGDDTS